jgi:hypothetical protein
MDPILPREMEAQLEAGTPPLNNQRGNHHYWANRCPNTAPQTAFAALMSATYLTP